MLLYHLFYNECKPVNINDLHSFSMKPIEAKYIEPVLPVLPEEPVEPSTDILHKIENQCIKVSKVQDGLFWSIYIGVYGYTEFLRNKYNYGKLEVREKQQIAEFVGSNTLKTNYKVTRSFSGEMVADLISLPRMVFSGLIGMCAYYKTDIYIVDIVKHTYLSFLGTGTGGGEIIVLYRNPLHTRKFDSNEYFLDAGFTIQSIEEIRENYYGMEHYDKPLKGISTYLKPDLENIASKTVFREMKSEETYSKQELYNHILIFLSEKIE